MDVQNRKTRIEEIPNKDHASDIKYAVQHTRWSLIVLGIWPSVTSNPTRNQRYVAIFTLPLCPIAIAALVGSMICHVTFRAKHVEDALAVLGPITYQTGNLLKSLILIFRRDTLKLLIQHIEANWRTLGTANDREIMMKYLKQGRDTMIICAVGLLGSASTIICTEPYLAESYTNELNQSVRALLFPGLDMLVNVSSGHNYEIVHVAICFCAYFDLFVHLATLNLASVFVTHACGQIQIVVSRLDGLVGSEYDVNDIVTLHDRIKFIVRNHVRVLKFASAIEDFLREICLIDVLVSTLTICWFEYACLTKLESNDFVTILPPLLLLIGLCLNLFVLCHVGELLKEQFEQVGKTSYMIDWDKLLGKTGLALVLVIAMGNYPCKLTAGRMIELSYYSFGSIMKTTIAYLNVMRAMVA